jgi:Domain of unknown function (DUF4440)
MKRCPTCNRTYTDQNLSYCIEDGTPLTITDDDGSTVVSPREKSESGQTDWNAIPYRPPSPYVPPGGQSERRVWPWAVGIISFLVVAFAGLAVSVWFLLPRISRTSVNRNDNISTSSNTESRANRENSNSNSSASTDDDAVVANTNTNAPTDKEQVLAQLTDLEHEWTVANINADKKKLNVILADDYVGPNEDGQMQGKKEYIRDIKREPSIERWEFEGLKVTLRGDRATLTGKIRFIIPGEERVFEFTDKFVWRDGRWQATGSIVSPAD